MHVALSQADVDGLATWVAMKARSGDDAASACCGCIGAAMARLAEAGDADPGRRSPTSRSTLTHDELTTARAYRAVAEFIPASAR